MSRLIREFGKDRENRRKMAAAARRGIGRGDASVYNNAVSSLLRSNGTKEEFQDFQDDFENEPLNDQPVNNLVGENIDRIIKETINKFINEDMYGYGGGGRTRHTWTVRFYADEIGGVGCTGVDVMEPAGIDERNWRSIMDDYRNPISQDIYNQIEKYLKERYPTLKNIRQIYRNN